MRPNAGRFRMSLTCIREKTTLAAAGRRLEANAERHLKAAGGDGAPLPRLSGGDRREPSRVARAHSPSRSTNFATNIRTKPTGNASSPQEALERLAEEGAPKRYPGGVPEKVTRMLSP